MFPPPCIKFEAVWQESSIERLVIPNVGVFPQQKRDPNTFCANRDIIMRNILSMSE